MFVFDVPSRRFVPRINNEWSFERSAPVDMGVQFLTQGLGLSADDAQHLLREQTYVCTFGTTTAPGEPEVVGDGFNRFVNLWAPPRLQPAPTPGPYPKLQRILEWLTQSDPAAIAWVKNWMAFKVQNPLVRPGVAPVFVTKEGGGKGTLAVVMHEMLGRRNTVEIKREALENRFNASWANKLFVLADEITSSESLRDISQELKTWITSSELLIEEKFAPKRKVPNHLAWMFSSNDEVSPVIIDEGGRRYSVFINYRSITPDYKKMVRTCFSTDGDYPSPEFDEEIQNFWAELLELDVDVAMAKTPYDNAARDSLIKANEPSHRQFFTYVDERGIDFVLTEGLRRSGDWALEKAKSDWDFGTKEEGGVTYRALSTQVLYRCYVEYCKAAGRKAIHVGKFGSVAQHHNPAWVKRRFFNAQGARINGYLVPYGTPGADGTAGATAAVEP